MHTDNSNAQRTWRDNAFCIIVGTVYLYSLTRVIFSATFIQLPQGTYITIGLFSIVLFMIAFANRVTRTVLLVVIALLALYATNLVRISTYYAMHPTIEHFYDVFHMIVGSGRHDIALGRTAVWIVSLLLGAFVTGFMFYKFSFVSLFAMGSIIFSAVWMPGFARDETAFLLFLFAFCMILLRKMNGSVSLSLRFIPFIALAILAINSYLPNDADIFVRRTLNPSSNRFVDAVSDRMFELFNPTHFTFQSTGFSGAGGQLGGPVTINNRPVMDVTGPGGIYLSGAVSNTYTGSSWISTLQEGDIYTHGLDAGHFEMLETAAALIRGATIAHTRAETPLSPFINILLPLAPQRVSHQDITTVAVLINGYGQYFLHTYLPFDTIEIVMGQQRSGSIFRPQNAWDLEFLRGSGGYRDLISTLPTGDMQAPRMLARGAGYQFQFLNVNTQLPFVQHLLRYASNGVYAQRVLDVNETTQVALYGEHQFLGTPEDILRLQGRGFPDDILLPFLSSSRISPDDMYIRIYEDSGEIFEQSLDYFLAHIYTHRPQPQLDPWEHSDISFAARAIHSAPYFGISEMQMLVDLLHRSSTHNNIGMLPSEAYLLYWLDRFSENVLEQYAQEVRLHFLDVPDIVPQRVRELTHMIVDGLATDFDRVMAIQDFLLQFPYTLTPVNVPSNVCFVDHFLFVGQEGYCTYFASAMTVMARIAGVPARYVEGFALPHIGYMHNFTVTNRMAHAWSEVYLEGFGWIIVEATPPYALGIESGTHADFAEGESRSNFNPEWFMDMRDDDRWHDFEVGVGDFPQVAAGTGTGATGQGPDENLDGNANNFLASVNFSILIPAILLVALLATIIPKVWHIYYSLAKVRKMAHDKQVIAFFTAILNIVEYYTVPLTSGETPKAYGDHKGKRFAFRSDSIFLRDLIALYYKAKYSPHEITKKDSDLMEEAYFDMLALLKSRRLPTRFAYIRYVRRVGIVQ